MRNRMRAEFTAEEAVWGSVLIAVSGYLAFAPSWNPMVAPRLYDCARALELLLLVATALAAFFPGMRQAIVDSWSRLGFPARLSLAVFVIGGALSATVSSAPHMGAQQVGLLVLLVWLVLSVSAMVRVLGRQAEHALTVAFSLGAALVLLRFWMIFVQSMAAGKEFSWVSPFLEFANIRFFGQYQAYALLLVALPLLAYRLTSAWRIVVGLVAAGFWMLEWIAASRAVWAGTVVAFIVVAATMRSGRMRWLAIQGGLLLAGGLLYLAFDNFFLNGTNATPLPSSLSITERSDESGSIRLTLARSALGMIARHPVAGVGPGQFGLHYSQTDAAHPHNSVLQLLAEYGLIAGTAGVVAGVLLLLFAVREIRRRTQSAPDMTTASLAAALIMGLTDALFSGNLIMPHSQVLLCVIAGWLLGRAPQPTPQTKVGFSPVLRTGLPGVVILAALVTTILLVEYLDVIRDMPYPPQLRIPSFWQYGRFTEW